MNPLPDTLDDVDGQGFRPGGIFAHKVGHGIGFLPSEIGEAQGLARYQAYPPHSILPFHVTRSPKVNGNNNDNNHEKPADTIVEEGTAPFRFGDLVPELRNRVYYFYAADRGNIPSTAIAVGQSTDKVYHRPKRQFPIHLDITRVSKLVRRESLPIIANELASRTFHLTYHDKTMLASPAEQSMLVAFGPSIQKVRLSRDGLLRCLQALPPHAPNLKTIDVQLASHPRYRHVAIHHQFPDDMSEEDVESKLKSDPNSLMQPWLNNNVRVQEIRGEYRSERDTLPEVYVPDRQWKVRFNVRVYMNLENEERDEGLRWRYNATFEAENGKVVEVVRLPLHPVPQVDL